jgi:nucleotide-binding universal stress UspA family protein
MPAEGSSGYHRIVVGIDGSDESAAALEWALTEARLRGSEVLAVTAWDFPAMVAGGMHPASVDEYARAAERTIEAVLRRVDTAGAAIRKAVRKGNPTHVLLEEAQDADLLVVGSRGHGGFAGLLLGSVSAQITHYSPCTTVIVRPQRHH